MSIITVYRGLSTKGKEIAERVSQCLGYTYVSHEQLLTEASEQFNVPLIKLTGSVDGASDTMSKLFYDKEKYLSYVECALLEHAQEDNMVYDGPTGNFLKGIKHVLNVCIVPKIESKVRRMYDLAFDMHDTSVSNAVETICLMLELERFKTTPESQRAMDDLVLAARVKSKLVSIAPNLIVSAYAGRIHVDIEAPQLQEARLFDEIKRLSEEIPGVMDIGVNIIPTDF